MASIPVALQLYTLREQTAEDFVGTVRRVAEIGYAGVEFAGYGGLSAREMKALLDEVGLRAAGSHVGLDLLENDLDGVIDYSLTIENPYVVCPFVPPDRRQDESAVLALVASFNRIGTACHAEGLHFCYHNHAFEFEVFNGRSMLDILYGETAPGLLEAEVDTYWAHYAGVDPADLIRRYSDRVTLVHLKDMDPQDRTFAEVGEGTMEWQAVFAASDAAGAEWYVVEQDRCKRPPLESVRISLENLRAMGVA